jgi:hypothetical protein
MLPSLKSQVAAIVTGALLLIAPSLAAAATEGPFYKVKGARLTAGQKAAFTGSASSNIVLVSKTTGITVSCTFLTLEKANLLGSTGANAGPSEEKIVLSTCSVSGNGTPCSVTAGIIRTEALVSSLDYNTAARSGVILVRFAPAAGAVLAKIGFSGAGCFQKETSVEGSVIGEALNSGLTVSVGAEPFETTTNEVRFPSKAIAVGYKEAAGSLTEQKTGLKEFGTAAALEGTAALGLPTGEVWGVYTK